MYYVLKNRYPVEVNQLAQSRGAGAAREPMHHAAVCIHERGSFGLTFTSALMMTNPTMNNRGNRSIDWPFLERQGPANETAGSHLPVVPVELGSPTNKHTNYQYT